MKKLVLVLATLLIHSPGTDALADDGATPPTSGPSVQAVNWATTPGFASASLNVTIIQSTDMNAAHDMDAEWQAVATAAGHTATIVSESVLEDIANLDGTQVLIVSSGVKPVSAQAVATVQQFVAERGPVYIQCEFSNTYTTNIAFGNMVNALGGSFTWGSMQSGSLVPMTVIGDLAVNPNVAAPLTYFFYGYTGAGDATVEPFLERNGAYYGWVFTPPAPAVGRLIATTDQDWTRLADTYPESGVLMANIMALMADNAATPVSEMSFGGVKAMYR
jgi:hypothetical protein